MEMEKLIVAVNKLHHICNEAGLNQVISLPRIVVVGDQSAGKSSILESFVGRPCVPRGDGIVTRCPINLQLINIQEPQEVVIDGKVKKLEDYVEFPLLDGIQQYVEDFGQIPQLIEAEVARLAGDDKNITDKEIIVKIYSKSVPTLTVIDLPGIIKNPVAGQVADIEQSSKRLILKYIKDENTIILAVMMATNEIASAESVKLAREYDQDLLRTILVVTKVDLGVEREKLRDTLEGKVKSFKLGIVGVINKMEPGVTFAEGRKREKKLLQKHLNTIASKHGGQNLIKLLQKCLFKSIKEQLPIMERDIEHKIKEAEEELMNIEQISTTESYHYLHSVVNEVAQRFKDDLVRVNDADTDGNEWTTRAEIAQICDSVMQMLPIFGMPDEEILRYVYNARALTSNLDVPEEAFQQITKKLIGEYEQPILTQMDKVRCKLLTQLLNSINAGGTQMLRFPVLISALKSESQMLLDQQLKTTKAIISGYISDNKRCIKTSRKDFKELAEKTFRKQSKGEDSEDEILESSYIRKMAVNPVSNSYTFDSQTQKSICSDMRNLVKKYCEVVAQEIQDYFLRLVNNRMIEDFHQSLSDTLFGKFCNQKEGKLAELLAEDEDTCLRREELKKFIQAMKEAQSVIMGVTTSII